MVDRPTTRTCGRSCRSAASSSLAPPCETSVESTFTRQQDKQLHGRGFRQPAASRRTLPQAWVGAAVEMAKHCCHLSAEVVYVESTFGTGTTLRTRSTSRSRSIRHRAHCPSALRAHQPRLWLPRRQGLSQRPGPTAGLIFARIDLGRRTRPAPAACTEGTAHRQKVSMVYPALVSGGRGVLAATIGWASWQNATSALSFGWLIQLSLLSCACKGARRGS